MSCARLARLSLSRVLVLPLRCVLPHERRVPVVLDRVVGPARQQVPRIVHVQPPSRSTTPRFVKAMSSLSSSPDGPPSDEATLFKGSTEDELRAYLTAHGIDTTAWGGQASSKSLRSLLNEILLGETFLHCVDGEPLRRVSIISVNIKNEQGLSLYEAEQRLPNGVKRRRNLLLSEKILPDESWWAASRRGIQEELGSVLDAESRIEVLDDTLEVSTETRTSGSYPGLKTEYRCHKVEARVSGLPAGDFETSEKRGDGTLLSSWQWRRPDEE